MKKKDDNSVGSDLPTVDQFEIAVPSKSFASTGEDAHFPEDAREEEAFDTRSNSDVSSITSVSYRAGYYYLRNAKKQSPERKAGESASCCVAPTCSCSWFSCCCCAEAKSELSATVPTSKNSIVMQQKQRKSHPSPSARRAMLLAQQQEMAQSMHARGPVHAGFVHPDAAAAAALTGHSRGMRQSSSRRQSHHRSSSRGRYHPNAMVNPTLLAMEPSRHPLVAAVDPQLMRGGGGMDHPGLQQNHSLFDELSEEEEIPSYGHRRMMMMPEKSKHKSSSKPSWLMRSSGGGGRRREAARGREVVPNHGRDRARSRSRGRGGRRFDRYQMH